MPHVLHSLGRWTASRGAALEVGIKASNDRRKDRGSEGKEAEAAHEASEAATARRREEGDISREGGGEPGATNPTRKKVGNLLSWKETEQERKVHSNRAREQHRSCWGWVAYCCNIRLQVGQVQ